MTAKSRARPLAFGKVRRLALAEEFNQVRTEGATQRGRLLILGTLSRPETADFRAGFVTSRRVGNAVVRNRVRRRLREIVRRHQCEVRPGFWIVIVARPAAATARYRALEDEWLRLAGRAFILAPSCA
ncbi:MAG: ribonuclease P protein component [Chthoniobacterales bacterium]